ncbi:NAD(P)/FAD-dependent oxidoreductase [soil metagenome]
MIDILIVGGGLAGLTNALLLSRKGYKVLLVEKKQYPFDKVCGEYVSNEVSSFLRSIEAFPKGEYPQINRFQLSSISGRSHTVPLRMGGFGISRYTFDHFLYEKAKEAGASFLLNCQVQKITFKNDNFQVLMRNGESLESRIVIGAYGKNSGLDRQMNRRFTTKRSPFIGVKYHIKYDFPEDLVALHNFKDGYCGLAAIENGKVNLCYLGQRNDLRKYGNIEEMEKKILYRNPFLKEVFSNAEFIYGKPEVINEISFEPKTAVEQHVLMSGDTAGLISPLCGNGMAMAIHSAKILSSQIHQYYSQRSFDRVALEKSYTSSWNSNFSRRLWVGRNVQKLFGTAISSEILISLATTFPPLVSWIIKQTHGKQI